MGGAGERLAATGASGRRSGAVSMIYIAKAGSKGRGVFAGKAFRPGDRVERAPVIVIPHVQLQFLEKTTLTYYTYSWGADGSDAAVAAGFGCFYNHSDEPNADYLKLVRQGFIDIVAIRPIRINEEITVNYNGSPNDRTPVWFDGDRWGWFHADGRRDE
jgi:SET domain-containing protein